MVKKTGMLSAELEHNNMVQGLEPESQVYRLIDNYSPGVAHIALSVGDVESAMQKLKNKGAQFDTSVIKGLGLKQSFTSRDSNTGLSFEITERT